MRIWWQQTTWVVLVPITTHIPGYINIAHTELWIFNFLLLANQNRYANEVLNMRIWWQQTTWVVFVPITIHIPSFINVAHTDQNRYANEVLNMHIRWRQTMRGVLVPPTTHILTKIGHCVLIREWKFTFWCWRDTSVRPFIQTAWQMKLSGPSSIAGSPQKKEYTWHLYHNHTNRKITTEFLNDF